LPDLWPDTDVWEPAGSCRGCEFSIFLGPAQENECNITDPSIVASYIAPWICGPNETAPTPFGPLCSRLCNNNCGTWFWNAIVKSMGSAFIAGLGELSSRNVAACLEPCSSDPTPAFDYGTYTCPPPFNDTGTLACACGTGHQACSPAPGFQPGGNPSAGDPRCVDAFGKPYNLRFIMSGGFLGLQGVEGFT